MEDKPELNALGCEVRTSKGVLRATVHLNEITLSEAFEISKLFASAPQLLEENRKLKERQKELEDKVEKLSTISTSSLKHSIDVGDAGLKATASLLDENRRLREALEFVIEHKGHMITTVIVDAIQKLKDGE